MALGGDPDPNPGGGEGALLSRQQQPRMFWKLSHATSSLGMRMLMRYNWRATNHEAARIFTEASKHGVSVGQVALENFNNISGGGVRPRSEPRKGEGEGEGEG